MDGDALGAVVAGDDAGDVAGDATVGGTAAGVVDPSIADARRSAPLENMALVVASSAGAAIRSGVNSSATYAGTGVHGSATHSGAHWTVCSAIVVRSCIAAVANASASSAVLTLGPVKRHCASAEMPSPPTTPSRGRGESPKDSQARCWASVSLRSVAQNTVSSSCTSAPVSLSGSGAA